MTNGSDPQGRDPLSEEAAFWFARMRGPDARLHAAEFERWLARGALHRSFYNRIAEVFSTGKMLKDHTFAPAEPGRRMVAPILVSAIAASALILTTWQLRAPQDRSATSIAEIADRSGAAVQYATIVGEIRRVRLTDGSHVTLDTDTLVSSRSSENERTLRLERGRARVHAVRGGPKFTIIADRLIANTSESVFDVSLLADKQPQLTVLRGSLALSTASQGDGFRFRNASIMVMQQGQGVQLVNDEVRVSPAVRTADWPSGTRTYNRTPLKAVVAEANRYTTEKIVVEDPEVQRLTISGSFRTTEASVLAERLAALLDLVVERDAYGRLVLRRPTP